MQEPVVEVWRSSTGHVHTQTLVLYQCCKPFFATK